MRSTFKVIALYEKRQRETGMQPAFEVLSYGRQRD